MTSFSGVLLFHAIIRGEPKGMKFCREILETLGCHTVKTRSVCGTWAWICIGT